MRKIINMCVSMVLALALTGCQGFWQKALPVITDIIIKVIDAEQQLDAIEQGVAVYLKESPDPETGAKVQAFLGRVKASLKIALATAEGVRSTGEGSSMQAFKDFQVAWTELIGLLAEIGVVDTAGALATGPYKGLQLTEPLALREDAP
jgi:hypothetical protein